jgi:hypothetical protein
MLDRLSTPDTEGTTVDEDKIKLKQNVENLGFSEIHVREIGRQRDFLAKVGDSKPGVSTCSTLQRIQTNSASNSLKNTSQKIQQASRTPNHILDFSDS